MKLVSLFTEPYNQTLFGILMNLGIKHGFWYDKLLCLGIVNNINMMQSITVLVFYTHSLIAVWHVHNIM